MIVLFLAFSIPPDWVYLNAKTVQDRHTQRGIEMDNKVLDEAVEVALSAVAALDDDAWPDDYDADDRRVAREAMRAALLAGVKVLLGEPVAWQLRCGPPDGMCSYRFTYTSEKNATDKAADYVRDGWSADVAALYAPSLGEGDGR